MVADLRTAPEQHEAERVSTRTPKRLRIGLLPYDSGVNLYAQRLRACLAELGDVVPVGTPKQRIARVFARKPAFDVIIAGWLENALVTERGRISYLGLAKMITQTLVLRAQSQRVIYVRHNRYPHHAQLQFARTMTQLLDAFEHLFDITLTHSPAEVGPHTAYCPHPLYDTSRYDDQTLLPRAIDLLPGYYVVFGRIAPYKNIETLIETFPEHQRLLVAGVVDDEAYADRLRQLCRPNVVIAPGYLSEAQAQSVVRRAAGVIVCHSADDVIVTGSFFYAISLGRPVLAVATPFLRAIQAQVGPRVLLTAADIVQLCQLLGQAGPAPSATPAEWAAVRLAFSDAVVCQHLTQLFTRLGIASAEPEPHTTHNIAEVAE